MQRSLSLTSLVILFFSSVFLWPLIPVARAETAPRVVSLTASPNVISNNYTAAIAWYMINASGGDILFQCPAGVGVKTPGNSTIPCNTRTSVGTTVSGSVAYTFTNISGAPQAVPIVLYPKDANGVDYDSGSAQISITVGTSAQPITNVWMSPTFATSSMPVTLSWTGLDIPAANVQFDCSNSLQFYKADGVTALPCGVPAFGSDLQRSGSVSFVVVNSSYSSAQATVHVLPAIVSGSYDATHAAAISFGVSGKIDQATPTSSGSATASTVFSSVPVNLSWSTQGSVGSNLQFACNDAISYQFLGTTTTMLPCGTPAFSPALSASGSADIVFVNKSDVLQRATVTILPLLANNTYDGIHSSIITMLVQPPVRSSASSTAPVPYQPSTTTPIKVGQPVFTSNIVPAKAVGSPITLPLERGSRGAQVTTLQTFLAQDATIYPEGSITGFFGPATEKAVERFQEKYSLAKIGDAWYGFVGPKTRNVMNAILKP